MLSLLSLQPINSAHAADLYSFTSHTFTNCTKSGNTGPTLALCTSSYSGQTWTATASNFNVGATGIQYWTVPKNGIYTIKAAGASGGVTSTYTPGYGSTLQGDFALAQGTVIAILVGQTGLSSSTAGGGGGSFVVKVSGQNDTSTATPLVIAGGGGGSVHTYGATSSNLYTNDNESSTVDSLGRAGTCTTWQVCTSPNFFLTNSTTPGSGGFVGTKGIAYGAGGGGGLNGNGQDNPNATKAYGGKSFFNGGTGGTSGSGGAGGFGGGGTGEFSTTCGAGGGGGYSGGGGGIYCGTGGGGGSLNLGSNQLNISGNNLGMGSVVVTYLSAWTPPAITGISFPGTANFRSSVTLGATVNTNGKVTFYALGKVIPGCRSIPMANSNGGTVTCNWRPSMRGAVNISVNFVSGAYSDSSLPIAISVGTRSGLR